MKPSKVAPMMEDVGGTGGAGGAGPSRQSDTSAGSGIHVLVDPPLREWDLIDSRARSANADSSVFGRFPPASRGLCEAANANAARLGLPRLTRTDHIIGTGHQAWLWHPGILAKDIVTRLAAARLRAEGRAGVGMVHLIVDQDVHPALGLDLPLVDGQQLRTLHVQLADEHAGVPTGFQPPADVDAVLTSLRPYRELTKHLLDAWTDLPPCRTLAEQLAVVLHRLKQPYAGDIPVIFTSDMAGWDGVNELIDVMLHDARRCAMTYNQAVAEHPEGGVSLLVEGRELVELPLWACAWMQPRRRVFADLANSGDPLLVLEDGQPVDRTTFSLLPRALFMTAILRSRYVDRFIHGKGGHLYDRITEMWWSAWRGETLSPLAVVSADVRLDFDVPVADRAELGGAVWYRHWLPHNVDRARVEADGKLTSEKAALLRHMNDDRDKPRRRASFQRIHDINHRLINQNHDLLRQADARLTSAHIGLTNAAAAARRDWSFALYPPQKLHALVKALAT